MMYLRTTSFSSTNLERMGVTDMSQPLTVWTADGRGLTNVVWSRVLRFQPRCTTLSDQEILIGLPRFLTPSKRPPQNYCQVRSMLDAQDGLTLATVCQFARYIWLIPIAVCISLEIVIRDGLIKLPAKPTAEEIPSAVFTDIDQIRMRTLLWYSAADRHSQTHAHDTCLLPAHPRGIVTHFMPNLDQKSHCPIAQSVPFLACPRV